jgi:hypothetical protein
VPDTTDPTTDPVAVTTDPAAILDRWRAIEQAATPGPWEGHSHGPATARVRDVWHDEIDRPLAERVLREADLQFIVTARTAIPLLAAAVEAALKLTGEWDTESDHLDDLAESPGADEEGRLILRGTAQGYSDCAADLRAAIASALAGKDAGDGAT